MSSEAITRNDLTNILNEVLPPINADYIVEQGTSGIWTYRKWNSGIAECWGSKSLVVAATHSWGNFYITQNPIAGETFPFEFVNTPTCQITNDSINGWIMCNPDLSTTHTQSWYPIRPTSTATLSISVGITAKGRWK